MVFVASAHSVSKDVKRFCESPVSVSLTIQRQQTSTPARKDVPLLQVDQAEPTNRAQPAIARVTAPLVPVAGLVLMTFASNPPSALVSFSGMGVCYTPCVTKLEPQRRYKVKMTLDGYADWTGEIVVEPGKPATVVGELQQQQ